MRDITYYSVPCVQPIALFTETIIDSSAMVQIPPYQRYDPLEHWKPIKDEIRWLTSNYGLSEINDNAFKVDTCVGVGDLYAVCEFRNENNARQMFRMYIQRSLIFEPC